MSLPGAPPSISAPDTIPSMKMIRSSRTAFRRSAFRISRSIKSPDAPIRFRDPSQPAAPYVIHATDPGKGLISGLCSDVSRTKGPILRGLRSRAPYFHNGAARDLSELLEFYNQRFQMNLTTEEKDELTAFLNAL